MGEQTKASGIRHPERVFVMSGPSGVGKNTIAARLCASGLAVRAVTATSRPARPGERDEVDYYFVSDGQFEDWLREGRLLEHTRYSDMYYGTPAFSVDRALQDGRPVLLLIDVDGAMQLKRRWEELNLVFVAPRSEEALRRRLRRRGDVGEKEIARRLERAREEMDVADQYDWVVVNDRLEDAVQEVARILSAAAGSR